MPPCKHGRKRNDCKECGGASICEHGRRRSQCKECGGASICKHGRQRSLCKECGGASFCEHGRRRSQCKECAVGAAGSSSGGSGAAQDEQGYSSDDDGLLVETWNELCPEDAAPGDRRKKRPAAEGSEIIHAPVPLPPHGRIHQPLYYVVDPQVKREEAGPSSAEDTNVERELINVDDPSNVDAVVKLCPEEIAEIQQVRGAEAAALLEQHAAAVRQQEEHHRSKRLKTYHENKDKEFSDADLFKCPRCYYPTYYPSDSRACNKLQCGNSTCRTSFCIQCGKPATASCRCIAASWAR